MAVAVIFLGMMKSGFSDGRENSASPDAPAVYINPFIENGSPLNWEIAANGEIVVGLLYDNERFSPNRASIHWHFLVEAPAGSDFQIVLENFVNIWNGTLSFPLGGHTSCYISDDGIVWRNIETEKIEGNRLRIRIHMDNDSLYVARLEPYRMSDLNRLLDEIKDKKSVATMPIGKTVEGQELKIIRIGRKNAPHRVWVRGRSHPWESGGNWVLEGLIKSLLEQTEDNKNYLEQYCLYILPMANMDGVRRGRTRFNTNGKDLNRNWDKPADLILAPENHAIENFIRDLITKGLKPDLAIDFHNDAEGNLQFASPDGNSKEYLGHMARFEEILKEHTWFREGSKGREFRNPGTFGDGLLERFGIEAFIFELNADWIAGRNKVPDSGDWLAMGSDLRKVFMSYFEGL
jgi:hypothetical protein